ncbi:MAG: cytochrome c [Gemmatimonadaceae bacterium]|nr:cytochrome c [Gemmatimonadaceae bacterium]
MSARVGLVLVFAGLAACGAPAASNADRVGVGRAPTAAELAVLDRDVGPDGTSLPLGSGTVAEGAVIFAAKCASCHGARGEGVPGTPYAQLIAPRIAGDSFPFGTDPSRPKTVGTYWPHATTLFDYIRRAMPFPAPGSLTDAENYAVTAWILAENGVFPRDGTLDAARLRTLKLPSAGRFVTDDRAGGPTIR